MVDDAEREGGKSVSAAAEAGGGNLSGKGGGGGRSEGKAGAGAGKAGPGVHVSADESEGKAADGDTRGNDMVVMENVMDRDAEGVASDGKMMEMVLDGMGMDRKRSMEEGLNESRKIHPSDLTSNVLANFLP
eukprot:11650735-Karenia_brevis.AAC.1